MKKKSLVLLTFILALGAFVPKLVDDRKAEMAFSKAISNDAPRISKSIKQVVTSTQSSIKTESKELKINKEENFDDVESLDFYNISLEEEIISDSTSEDVEFPNQESTTIEKQVVAFSLPNRSKKVLNSLTKKSVSKKIYELDISDPITVQKVKLQQTLTVTKWASLEIKIKDYSSEPEPVMLAKNTRGSDRISTTLASNEKPAVLSQPLVDQPLKEIELKSDKTDSVKDDLVFFDYSDEAPKSTGKKVVPVVVGSASLQQMNSSATPISVNSDKTDSKKEEAKKLWNLYANNIPVKPTKPSEAIQSQSNKNIYSSKTYKSNLLIKPYIIGTKQPVRNFDIRFSDDYNEILSDSGNGEVNISAKISNEMSIRRSTVIVKNMMPTTLDLVFEAGDDIASVPMISNKKMEQILTSQNFRGNESFLLVELDRTTEDVEIDAKFAGKVFLNSKFKVVNRADSDFNYILFVDAMPGNTIINFLNTKNETISKIIHLAAEEVYFEPNYFREVEEDEFDLHEENLLSKAIAPLSIDSNDIKGLTYDTKFKKLTLNKYQAGPVLYPLGARSYLQLNHLSETVFVGRWNNEQVTIPSETYMRFVLGQFSIGSVGSQCLIQINLSKKANSYSLSGKAADRMMGIQTKILDADGLFYSDFSAESKKIFILGEEQGIINAKISYTDGSEDYLQSYCSNSTYLVEQL